MKKNVVGIFSLVVMHLGSACSTSGSAAVPLEVTVAQVISSPRSYKGKLIKLRVFAVTSVEGAVAFDDSLSGASINIRELPDNTVGAQDFYLKSFGVGGRGNPASVQATVIGVVELGKKNNPELLIKDVTDISVN